jgi:hypothetical protein
MSTEYDNRYFTPVLSLEQLQAAQELGNLIQLWATDVLSMNEARMTRLRELGEMFTVDVAQALWSYQQKHRENILATGEKLVHDFFGAMDESLGLRERNAGGPNPPLPALLADRYKPQRVDPSKMGFPVGNEDEPYQDSGPFEADRVLQEIQDLQAEFVALNIHASSRKLDESESDRREFLKQRLAEHGIMVETVGQPFHPENEAPAAVRPYVEGSPEHGLITHSPDYQPDGGPHGTMIDVPIDAVNASESTGHVNKES